LVSLAMSIEKLTSNAATLPFFLLLHGSLVLSFYSLRVGWYIAYGCFWYSSSV
jgi:hypothetical protein